MTKEYYVNSKPVSIEDIRHPLRQMAERIIREVVEVHLGTEVKGEKYYKMENDIVALLTNME